MCALIASAALAITLAAQMFSASVARETGQAPQYAVPPELAGALQSWVDEARREIGRAAN